jgi:hypothetical protein
MPAIRLRTPPLAPRRGAAFPEREMDVVSPIHPLPDLDALIAGFAETAKAAIPQSKGP